MNRSIAENIELKRVQTLYQQALVLEEIFRKEKAGDKWIKKGDNNTAYFHAKVKAINIFLTTRIQLGEDDKWTEDPLSIHEATISFYHSLLMSSTQHEGEQNLLDVIPILITRYQNDLLVVMPSFDKLKEAVFTHNPLSALGPYDLMLIFTNFAGKQWVKTSTGL